MTPLAYQAYELLRTVPTGRVTTYKALATACGTRAYRAIGQAMRRNPFAPEVPCHRVVASDGRLGGFMGKRSGRMIQKKIDLLTREGIVIEKNLIVDFEKFEYIFSHAPPSVLT